MTSSSTHATVPAGQRIRPTTARPTPSCSSVASKVSDILADRLEELADDDGYLHGVVDAARNAAWDEIGASIEAKLARRPELEDPETYRAQRDHRIQQLLSVDLPLLEASAEPQY